MGSNLGLIYVHDRHMLHHGAASACQYNECKRPEGDACWAILFLFLMTVLTAISWKCHNQSMQCAVG
jgi:hypothetical protein